MTQLAIDIPALTVRVLKARKTLASDAVEADRVDGVGAGVMPRLLVFSHDEGRASARQAALGRSPWS